MPDELMRTAVAAMKTGHWALILVVLLLIVAFLAQKLLKSSVETGAGTDVVSLLRSELDRLATHNTTLTTKLNELQHEIIQLNTQLIALSKENASLHSEVQRLTQEVGRFQCLLNRSEK